MWVGTGSWIMNMSGAIASLDSSTIYAFNAYSLTGLEYPQFLVLNSTTGSSLQKYKFKIKENILIFLF